MKLDTKALRYLTADDWRVLTAVESGSKNHEIVPTRDLLRLRGGSGVHKSISTLAKANLIARMKNAKYDGYRLTYGGLDYLALHTHLKHTTVYSTGNCIGVGKESDIYVVASPSGTQLILKIHRLGRISFRSIKNNRDYLRHRTSASWMYMSRLSALKEFAFMKVLRENGFRVPEPIAQSRHTVVMELINALPLRQIQSVADPAGLYAELIEVILKLASFGLIHGDFNEFNILIREDQVATSPYAKGQYLEESELPSEAHALDSGANPRDDSVNAPRSHSRSTKLTPVIIDFPQMVSMDHSNAEMYFDRDINCIKRFFERRFNFVSDEQGPFFAEAKKLSSGTQSKRLDVEVEASGFSRKMAKDLGDYMQAVSVNGDRRHDEDDLGEGYESNESDDSLGRPDRPDDAPRHLSPNKLDRDTNNGENPTASGKSRTSVSPKSIDANQ